MRVVHVLPASSFNHASYLLPMRVSSFTFRISIYHTIIWVTSTESGSFRPVNKTLVVIAYSCLEVEACMYWKRGTSGENTIYFPRKFLNCLNYRRISSRFMHEYQYDFSLSVCFPYMYITADVQDCYDWWIDFVIETLSIWLSLWVTPSQCVCVCLCAFACVCV